MGAGMSSDAGGTIVAPGVRDLDETARVLTGWFGSRLPDARDLRLSGLTYPRGAGQSHETILFDAHWRDGADEVTQGFVVRIQPTSFTVFRDDMFREEYELMRAVGARGTVPIARVHWMEEDPGVLGAPFFVMEKLHGRVAVSLPSYLDSGWVAEATPAERERLWDSCVRALAAVQTVPVAELGFLDLPGGDTGFDQEWDRWERYLDHVDRVDRPLPSLRALLERLRAGVPDNRPEGLVWGDARIGNMMVDDDFRVIALMDWEQPSLGGALHDLGWWLINQRGKVEGRPGGALPGMLSRVDTIALWERVTGISAESIDWYEAFAALKLGCLMVNLLDLRGQPAGDHTSALYVAFARQLLGD